MNIAENSVEAAHLSKSSKNDDANQSSEQLNTVKAKLKKASMKIRAIN